MNPLALVVVMAALAADKPQIAQNPVLTELLNQGVKISDGSLVKLPPPALPNGLGAAAQLQRITNLVGGQKNFDKMAARTPEAAIVNPIKRDKRATTIVRNIDLYFIAYGDWKKLSSRDFLHGLLTGNQKQVTSKTLTAQDLAKRGITPQARGGQEEVYFYNKVPILDQVELSSTTYSVGDRGNDWLLIASNTDPRFDRDAEYPNQWRSMAMNPAAIWVLGDPHIYDGSGFYVKATKLAALQDAIFVEYHMVFEEPVAWFDGSVALPSKLKLLIQDAVKRVRSKL
jgi:hypothetical protein